eukprot:jgi/Botrbrau1/3546/Bobra.0078s0003.1
MRRKHKHRGYIGGKERGYMPPRRGPTQGLRTDFGINHARSQNRTLDKSILKDIYQTRTLIMDQASPA